MEWDTPIWEHDLEAGLRLLRLAVDTHLITSHHALPLLLREPGGLLVEVTDGTREYNATHYRLSVFYDLAKEAVNRMALVAGARARPARRDRAGAHAGLDAVGDDARALRRARGELARRLRGAAALRASPRRPRTSAAPWPRWPPIPAAPAGTARRCRAARWPRSTASPTSTAAVRMPGATSSRYQERGQPADVTGYR